MVAEGVLDVAPHTCLLSQLFRVRGLVSKGPPITCPEVRSATSFSEGKKPKGEIIIRVGRETLELRIKEPIQGIKSISTARGPSTVGDSILTRCTVLRVG